MEDLHQLLQFLGIEQAHVAGLSMGGNMALLVRADAPGGRTVDHRGRARAQAARTPRTFTKQSIGYAETLESGGTAAMDGYLRGPTRIRFLQKDPRGWQEFADLFMDHSAQGKALTLRGYQARRRSIMSLDEELRAMQVPTLIILGDEDDPCLEPAIYMKRRIPRSGIVVLPQCGHACNIEEPDAFKPRRRRLPHCRRRGPLGRPRPGLRRRLHQPLRRGVGVATVQRDGA